MKITQYFTHKEVIEKIKKYEGEFDTIEITNSTNRKEFAEYNSGTFTELVKIELQDYYTEKVIASFPVMSMRWKTYERIQDDFENVSSRLYELYVSLAVDSIYSATISSEYADFFGGEEEKKIRGQFLDNVVELSKVVKEQLSQYRIMSDSSTVQMAIWNQQTREYIREYFEKDEESKK